MRLAPQPGELIDRSRTIEFQFNGHSYEAHPGDTIISALSAAGVTIISRSFKYRRLRGPMTADYLDPNCLLGVNGEPNVRGAHRLVEPGMVVTSQTGWPTLRFDTKLVTRAVGPLLGPGFYYKTFMRPQSIQSLYHRVLRTFTAGGQAPTKRPDASFDKRYAHADVVVAGAGPAGIAAALAAAEAGARVILVEENHHIGGHLLWGGESELETLGMLNSSLAESGVELMTNSVVAGRYDDNWLGIVQRGLPDVFERLVKTRTAMLVVAAGLIERPFVFAGNDLPGVMLATAARRLINLYGVKPGHRAVVYTADPQGEAAAEDLARAGIDVAGVVDARRGESVNRATGGSRVQKVELDDGTSVEADLLVTAAGWTAPTALLNMAGATIEYEPDLARFVPTGMPKDVLVTGGLAGDGDLDLLIAHGRAIGTVAAQRAGSGDSTDSVAIPELNRDGGPPEVYQAATNGFVDFSEDIKAADMATAVAEGFDSMELAKRFTTVTMGPTQGKLELANAIAVHAAATGRGIAETGTTTWRPPYAPVTLGALAGRILEPVRRSPMHDWHAANGAQPLNAGQWVRPEHYGDPAGEVRNVRDNVGIIDITPLGKLDLRGSDVPQLLNHVYINDWSDLPVGTVRYGVMCADDGVVFDDGVTGRLDDSRYMMTTTTSGAGNVAASLEEWLQTAHTEWDVQLTPVTSNYASINIAGPNSRALMERVATRVDLAPTAFPYMRLRQAQIAGVDDCLVWRIGFTGELSYEIHVPAGYGLHVWEALLDAGSDLGVGPFGIEAQRIMRLEKGHFIVGQDTDGLTQAPSAGLNWLIDLTKDDFVGKPELAWASESQPAQRLAAFQPLDPSIVPAEGSQIVEGQRTRGRVTSSRWSPTLERSICLGQIDLQLAVPDGIIAIQLPDGSRTRARVMKRLAHFDPEGTRLRG
jgi:sarcosine oxidase subunit alpha